MRIQWMNQFKRHPCHPHPIHNTYSQGLRDGFPNDVNQPIQVLYKRWAQSALYNHFSPLNRHACWSPSTHPSMDIHTAAGRLDSLMRGKGLDLMWRSLENYWNLAHCRSFGSFTNQLVGSYLQERHQGFSTVPIGKPIFGSRYNFLWFHVEPSVKWVLLGIKKVLQRVLLWDSRITLLGCR